MKTLTLNGNISLDSDSQIDCDSAAHRAFELVDAFLIALYMLIPVAWLVLLSRVRHRLLPPGIIDEELIFDMRDKDGHLSSPRFLFRGPTQKHAASKTASCPLLRSLRLTAAWCPTQ